MNNDNLKKSALSGSLWKFAERICAEGVSLAVQIFLARLLLPEEFGVVSLVQIFFTFCNILISGGLNTALIQKKDADKKDYFTIFSVNMLMATVLYAVMFFCAPSIAGLYGKPLLIPIIRVMGLTFFINGFKAVLSAYTSSHLQFKKFFLSTIGGTVFSAAVGIAMAYQGFGPWALVAQQMTNALVDTVILSITCRFRARFYFSFTRFKQLFGFGWKVLLTSGISVLYDEINPLIVGLRFSSADLSFYTKGRNFPNLLNTTVSNTLAAVLFPVMSKVQDDKAAVLNMTRRYIKLSGYLAFPLMLGFFGAADSFVLGLLGEHWAGAAVYIRIFCVSYMFNIVHVGNLEAIKAIGRSDISLLLEILKKSLYFLVIFLFVTFSHRPELLATSSVVCTLIATAINTFPNKKLIGYRYRLQIADLLPNLILSLIMGAGVYALNFTSLSPLPLLFVQILAGVLLYAVLSLITKNENFFYLLTTLKQMIKRGE